MGVASGIENLPASEHLVADQASVQAKSRSLGDHLAERLAGIATHEDIVSHRGVTDGESGD